MAARKRARKRRVGKKQASGSTTRAGRIRSTQVKRRCVKSRRKRKSSATPRVRKVYIVLTK